MFVRLLRLGHRITVTGAFAVSLAACATNQPSGSNSYQVGYTDGCVTGFGDAGKPGYESVYRRDDARFTADSEYQRGWNEGEKSCYTAEMNFPTMGGTADRGVIRGP